jgi:2-methylcitrate dehydratase PrpD
MTMDPINVIVKHFNSTKYEDLSPQIVEAVKKAVLDTMGAAIAGSSNEAGRTAVRIAKGYGNGKGSTIVVDGGKAAPPLAALANGVMARCREMDGTHEGGGGHVGVCIVPAAFAVAENSKPAVSGKDLIVAIALGVDMLCRLRMGAGDAKAIGWMAETLAPLSVAATGAKLLRLDDEKTLNAVGIAYASCSGNVQPTVEGAWTLWLPAGTAAASGILALDLAREGFLGARSPLRGEFGLYRLYFRGGYDEGQLLGQLGERNEIVNTSMKPYPTCKYTHHAIYTTLKLVQEHDIKPEKVKEVTVATSTMAATQCGFDEKGQPKTTPQSVGAAQFSIPFTVATAVVKRRVSIEDLTEESIVNPVLLANAQKVRLKVDPRKDSMEMLYPPADVEIKTTDGGIYSGCEPFVKGHPKNPFSLAECIENFRSRASMSAKTMRPDSLDRFIRMTEDLESVKDVSEMMSCLV